ncbi:hypothetical protein RHO13_10765 [Orbus wheelerorum]|uniref:hypothetical protein n=1 Tax=Orbus wheelerorum TaxID=3074111 RepID=UPI00370D32C8
MNIVNQEQTMTLIKQGFMLIITLFLLAGCNDSKLQNVLQEGFDSSNPTGKTGICFTIGALNYPYTSHEVTGELDENGYNRFIERNDILNKGLAIFSQLGLLSEQPAVDKDGKPTGFYHYDLTELGKKYRYYHNDKQVFCFGRMVVDAITKKREETSNLGPVLAVTYRYHIEGEIPQWAISPLLNQIIQFSKNNEPIDWSYRFGNQRFDKHQDKLYSQVPIRSKIIGN